MPGAFFEDPDDTREEILAATYRTLCEHGYADPTISLIGEEFEKSPSLIYHHYEGKDDLVRACLEFILDRFEDRMTGGEIEDPQAELEAFLAWLLVPAPDDDGDQFLATIVELRSRAIHDAAYREHFTRSDRVLETSLADLLEAGIERDLFRACDPDRVARTIATTLTGVMVRRSSDGGDGAWLDSVRTELEQYLTDRIYAEDRSASLDGVDRSA